MVVSLLLERESILTQTTRLPASAALMTAVTIASLVERDQSATGCSVPVPVIDLLAVASDMLLATPSSSRCSVYPLSSVWLPG